MESLTNNLKKLIDTTHPKCLHLHLKKLDKEQLIELTFYIENVSTLDVLMKLNVLNFL
jgi:DNA-binding HxlR family transcriptional regulator